MTATIDDPEVQPSHVTDEDGAGELLELRDEIRKQGRSIKDTQRAFSIFAVLAFLIAMCTLLAVAFKLDGKSSHVTTVTAPAAAAASPATAAPAPLAHKVSVALSEFKVVPTATTAGAGKVTFAVHNAGAVTHEFVVLRTAKPAADLLRGARADEAGNVGETGDLRAGASKSITLNLKPGHYALICNLPGHYTSGQHTDFTVR
jgi:uncharacterized cupredoxin-like copper-binding protein